MSEEPASVAALEERRFLKSEEPAASSSVDLDASGKALAAAKADAARAAAACRMPYDYQQQDSNSSSSYIDPTLSSAPGQQTAAAAPQPPPPPVASAAPGAAPHHQQQQQLQQQQHPQYSLEDQARYESDMYRYGVYSHAERPAYDHVMYDQRAAMYSYSDLSHVSIYFDFFTIGQSLHEKVFLKIALSSIFND